MVFVKSSENKRLEKLFEVLGTIAKKYPESSFYSGCYNACYEDKHIYIPLR